MTEGEEKWLGVSKDEAFEELKEEYKLQGRDLVGTLQTVRTKSEGKLLQVFKNPKPTRSYKMTVKCPEFTTMCPKTGQPDFATITIEYLPDKVCVELKALKLYLWSYRNEGHFHEEVINLILDDIVCAINPKWMKVTGEFWIRGGMTPVVEAEYSQKS